jgi:hypothetical protein
MKNLWNWQGVDADLETSLMECGLVWCKNESCTNEDELFFLYPSPFGCVDGEGDHLFGCAYNRESEVNDLVNGKDWMKPAQIEGFLSFVGMERKAWLELSHGQKVADLVSYFGVENILGTDYNPQPLEDFFFWKKHPIF